LTVRGLPVLLMMICLAVPDAADALHTVSVPTCRKPEIILVAPLGV
jgi:hypothetical protein